MAWSIIRGTLVSFPDIRMSGNKTSTMCTTSQMELSTGLTESRLKGWA